MTAAARSGPLPSIGGARRALAQSFRRAGLATPALDARVLLAHALGLDHAQLVAQDARPLAAPENDAIAELAARRLRHEPVARIIGVKEFWGLDCRLNSATLVPRPETETVVDAALAAVDGSGGRTRPLTFADFGTGSGALLLALLAELPSAYGIGIDLALDALRCARDNASAHGFARRAAFVACDYGTCLEGELDLIVSNPPYVVHDEIATLAAEVRLFDPLLALDGGPDGLAGYRGVAAAARRLLAPGGVLVVELGSGQAQAVEGLLSAAGLDALGGPRHDVSGIARALTARLPP